MPEASEKASKLAPELRMMRPAGVGVGLAGVGVGREGGLPGAAVAVEVGVASAVEAGAASASSASSASAATAAAAKSRCAGDVAPASGGALGVLMRAWWCVSWWVS